MTAVDERVSQQVGQAPAIACENPECQRVATMRVFTPCHHWYTVCEPCLYDLRAKWIEVRPIIRMMELLKGEPQAVCLQCQGPIPSDWTWPAEPL